jgi:hypothetical protein
VLLHRTFTLFALYACPCPVMAIPMSIPILAITISIHLLVLPLQGSILPIKRNMEKIGMETEWN